MSQSSSCHRNTQESTHRAPGTANQGSPCTCTQKAKQGDKVFLIHTAEGKHHKIKSQKIQVLPNHKDTGGSYLTIKAMDRGVLETVCTTPFGIEISIVPEDY